jgi:hypothetical protein
LLEADLVSFIIVFCHLLLRCRPLTTESIQARIASQKTVGATPLSDDPERGYEALNKLMGKHFKPAES